MLGCICFCARIRPLAVLLLVVTLAVLLIAVGAAGNFTPHLALATEAQTDEMENELG